MALVADRHWAPKKIAQHWNARLDSFALAKCMAWRVAGDLWYGVEAGTKWVARALRCAVNMSTAQGHGGAAAGLDAGKEWFRPPQHVKRHY